jgi:hypothetical protein
MPPFESNRKEKDVDTDKNQEMESPRIDTKEELGAFAILHWPYIVKIAAALSIGGSLIAFTLSGFSITCKKGSFEKTPVMIEQK